MELLTSLHSTNDAYRLEYCFSDRLLAGRGHTIIEVNRPDRSTRRRLGKSDPVDAEMAARSVLSGVARDQPKSGLDSVEMIRMLKVVKDSAVKARTQAINQIKALIVTAPSELRHELVSLDVPRLVARCARFRPGHLATPAGAAKYSLRLLARRHGQLTSEIEGVLERCAIELCWLLASGSPCPPGYRRAIPRRPPAGQDQSDPMGVGHKRWYHGGEVGTGVQGTGGTRRSDCDRAGDRLLG